MCIWILKYSSILWMLDIEIQCIHYYKRYPYNYTQDILTYIHKQDILIYIQDILICSAYHLQNCVQKLLWDQY